MGKKEQNISWDDFQKLGNPENAPDLEIDKEEKMNYNTLSCRIHIAKKGGGKIVSIVKGLNMSDDRLKDLAKDLKSKCGVGGSSKNREIIIQGDQRDKIMDHLKSLGLKDVKKSGG